MISFIFASCLQAVCHAINSDIYLHRTYYGFYMVSSIMRYVFIFFRGVGIYYSSSQEGFRKRRCAPLRYNIYAINELRVINIEAHAIHHCQSLSDCEDNNNNHACTVVGVIKNPTHELRWFHAFYSIITRGAKADHGSGFF